MENLERGKRRGKREGDERGDDNTRRHNGEKEGGMERRRIEGTYGEREEKREGKEDDTWRQGRRRRGRHKDKRERGGVGRGSDRMWREGEEERHVKNRSTE